MNCNFLQVRLLLLTSLLPSLLVAQYVGDSPFSPENGGLMINEVSNGIAGNASEEYIELLVLASPENPGASVDISGWIIDDNNAPNTGQGTAMGHLKFGDCYTALLPGSMLVIYNADDPNPVLPAADPTDADGDGVYVIPHNSDCMIACNSNPFASNRNGADPNRSDYCPCQDGSTSVPNWQVGLRNAGDVLQIRDKCETVVHAIHWGTVDMVAEVENAATLLHFDEGQGGRNLIFQDGDWNDVNQWSSVDYLTNETPGLANSVANDLFINQIKAGIGISNGTVDNCDDTDAGDLLFPTGFDAIPIQICRGDDLLAFGRDYTMSDEFEPSGDGFSYQYAYLLTTTAAPNFIILDYNSTGDFDFTDATGDRYFIWGFSYLRTDGGPDVIEFLRNEVFSVADIRAYIDCGYFFDVDNLTQDGEVMEVQIGEAPEAIPLEFEICEENEGQISLDLRDLAFFVAYEQDSVLWFSDPATSMRIDDREIFTTGDNLIYAQAYLGECFTDPTTVLIDVVPQPTIDARIQNRSCNGAEDSAVEFEITGDRPPYSVNWWNSDWNGQNSINGLPAGAYEVTIVDNANICRTTYNFEILEPDVIYLACMPTTPPSNPEMPNGIFRYEISGGTPPYMLNWGMDFRIQDSAGLDSLTNLPAGQYTFLITDAIGCTQQCDFEVGALMCSITTEIDSTLCFGEFLEMNGTIFDVDNPMGSVFIDGEATASCDTLINIMLTFQDDPVQRLDNRLCLDASLSINGTIYDVNNPSGTEILTSSNGCDSTIIIDLSFGELDTTFLQQSLCFQESVVVNGTTYDVTNPSGLEVMQSQISTCDSIISIDLNFLPLASRLIDTVLCADGFLEINGRIYDRDSPTGTQVLNSGSVSGCDSIININLAFSEPVIADFSPTICADGELIINGTSYNATNPTGVEVLLGASQFACDSIVNISLQFSDEIQTNLTETLCAGESIQVNGTIYDVNNPTGQEILTATGGCDSTVVIDLSFREAVVFELSQEFCNGESLEINGTTYDVNNPNGTEVLIGASQLGCDSTVLVNLEFVEVITASFIATLCEDETIEIGGVTFNKDMPNGVLTLANASATGCDSLLEVSLTFEAQDTTQLLQNLCSGEEIFVNGVRYDESKPTGIERITNPIGCDSLVAVDLNFTTAITATTSSEIPNCFGGEDASLSIENLVGGTAPYTLFLGDQSQIFTDNSIRFSNLSAGNYTLEIEDANACVSTQNISIQNPEALLVELGENLRISIGDSIQLQAVISDNVVDWEWSSAVLLSDATSLSPFAAPPRSTIFTLTVFDEAGCSVSDELQIVVNFERNIFIPTAFSPNGDGTNDFFTIYTDAKALNIQQFQIYDRWGNLVFERNDFQANTPQLGWNGYINDELANSSIYTCFATIEFLDGKVERFSGEFLLVL